MGLSQEAAAAEAGPKAAAAALKAQGNAAFKAGDYTGAVQQYTEAIKLKWDDAAILNNR